MSLIAELKRRNVIRMAGLYLVGAWLLVQVAGTLLPVFDAPSWAMKTLVGLLAVGFVPALVFSWVFELTPQGIKRDAEVNPAESIAPQTGRRMDRTIIVVLVLALGYFGFDKFVLAPRRDAALVAAATRSGAAEAAATATAAPVVVPRSIAVLPFVNMSGDAANEYFSDGITEEILNALTQIPDLKVAARTSAFAFKGKDEDLRKVGDTLGVATVLEGSVQRAGDEVRITAQLIDVSSGFHLWSQKFDRKLTNIFAVEDEISRAIAERLKLQLSGGGATPAAQRTVDPRAHDLYLRGLALVPRRGAALRNAKAAFEQAVGIDPTYAQAWAQLSLVHELLPAYGLAEWPSSMQQSEAAARRALALDPQLGIGHMAMATVLRDLLKFAEADQEYRRAIALNPGDAETRDQYAQLLQMAASTDAAIAQARIAVSLDPLAPHPQYLLGYLLGWAHHSEGSIAQLRKSLDLAPDLAIARFELALTYIDVGNFAAAEEQAREGARQSGEDPQLAAELVRAVADPTLRAGVIRRLDQGGIAGSYEFYGASSALWYCLLGAREKAVDGFLQVIDRAAPGERFYDLEGTPAPAFDPIRNDPRFVAMLARFGLPYRPASGTAP
jgi:adenylate cyclase